jgi:hypothetical protein
MNDLARAVWAEALKLKRTLALRLAVGAPLVIVLIVFGAYLQRGSREQDGLIGQAQLSLTLWTILLLPFYSALAAALLASVEHQSDNWKHLLALPVDSRTVFLAKWVAAFGLLALSFGTLIVGVSAAAHALRLWTPALHGAASPLPFMTRRGIESFLAAGLMLSIQLWVSLRWRTFLAGISLAAGAVVLMVALVPHGVTLMAYAFPWALPVTAMAPHSLHRVLAIAIGAVGGVIVGAVACLDLPRQEFLP